MATTTKQTPTVTTPDGKTQPAYINNQGQAFTDPNMTQRVTSGSVVTDASGRQWQKGAGDTAGTAVANTSGGYVAPTPAAPSQITSAQLRSAADLAALYGGINYDENAIRGQFQDATAAEYAAKEKEYAATEKQFYNRLYGTQSTALDSIRKANASAVATGASRGMQAANELSSILGLEQTSTDDSTQLAQDRNLLVDQKTAALKQDVVDALKYANDTKLSLGSLGSNIYASDAQIDIGKLDYAARLDAAAKALQGNQLAANAQLGSAQIAADASKYGADKNLQGTQYNADKNLQGSQYNADKNLQGSQYTADKNLQGTIYNADQNLKGAQAQASATATAAQANAPKDLTTALAAAPNYDAFYIIAVQGGINNEDTIKKLYDALHPPVSSPLPKVPGTGGSGVVTTGTPSPMKTGTVYAPQPVPTGKDKEENDKALRQR